MEIAKKPTSACQYISIHSGTSSSAVVVTEAGSEAMCSALMTAMLNDSEIEGAQMYVFKEAGGDEEVIWYGAAGASMGF